MINHRPLNFLFFVLIILSSGAALADKPGNRGGENSEGNIATIIEDVIVDVVDSTVDKARGVVREKAGVDITRRGYSYDRDHAPLPDCASGEAERELTQLQDEYNRENRQLEQELERKLDQAETEFQREAAREDKPEKVYEKREKLEKKVNAAYAKFDEKLAMRNLKLDEKRDSIVNRERGGENCSRAE